MIQEISATTLGHLARWLTWSPSSSSLAPALRRLRPACSRGPDLAGRVPGAEGTGVVSRLARVRGARRLRAVAVLPASVLKPVGREGVVVQVGLTRGGIAGLRLVGGPGPAGIGLAVGRLGAAVGPRRVGVVVGVLVAGGVRVTGTRVRVRGVCLTAGVGIDARVGVARSLEAAGRGGAVAARRGVVSAGGEAAGCGVLPRPLVAVGRLVVAGWLVAAGPLLVAAGPVAGLRSVAARIGGVPGIAGAGRR